MDEKEEIKNRIDIVDFISGYLSLKKSGRNFKALCPFHSEKTPSFMVSPERQIWHCFGCNEGGDIFTFLMKMDGLDFSEALQVLAQRAGVSLGKTIFGKKDEKTKLKQLNELASLFFHKILLETKSGKKVLDYLKQRNISPKTTSEFRLGFAPNDYDLLLRFLRQKGFKDEDIYRAGLITKKNQGYQDLFRNRLIFPILNSQGDAVAFTGRVLDDSLPKYLNSPQTPIYDKSSILFGFDKAKSDVREKDEILLVEGNMDVIACHQAGIKNTVCTSGSALTETQIIQIKRFTPNIKIAFDKDNAGQEATKRAINLALECEMNVFVVLIPQGKDPADTIKENPSLFKEALKATVYWPDFVLEKITESHNLKNIVDKKKAAKELFLFLREIQNLVEKNHYIKKVAKLLEMPEDLVLSQIKSPLSASTEKEDQQEIKEFSKQELEESLLGLLIKYPEHLAILFRHLAQTDLDFVHQPIYNALETLFSKKETIDQESLIKILPEEKAKVQEIVFKTEILFAGFGEEEIADEIFFSVKRIKRLNTEKIKKELEEKIRLAEKEENQEETQKLLTSLQELILNEIEV